MVWVLRCGLCFGGDLGIVWRDCASLVCLVDVVVRLWRVALLVGCF